MTHQHSGGTLDVGDRIELRHGPFLSTWRVAKVLERGAQLEYVGDVRFVGHRDVQHAPNGAQLTDNPDQAWLGAAHFAEAKRV